ncbi:MAG: CRISPR-associated endonuclease Cas2 [Nitrososphaerota archaeon]|jgi:CRISPR-associated protein Cas2|nr:CRISPR-associated endonuclease Cas2 [Nitrososphaerota archaeon]
MRNKVIVAYDVSDPERLRRIHGKMLGFGYQLQYSVFICELSAAERVLMVASLLEILNPGEDRVMLADLGPVGKASASRVKFLGKLSGVSPRHPVVV